MQISLQTVYGCWMKLPFGVWSDHLRPCDSWESCDGERRLVISSWMHNTSECGKVWMRVELIWWLHHNLETSSLTIVLDWGCLPLFCKHWPLLFHWFLRSHHEPCITWCDVAFWNLEDWIIFKLDNTKSTQVWQFGNKNWRPQVINTSEMINASRFVCGYIFVKNYGWYIYSRLIGLIAISLYKANWQP